MHLDLSSLELSPAQFAAVRETVYRVAGINLHEGKEGLVRTRLTGRMRELKLAGFDEYLARVAADATGGELAAMIDVLTTNKTSFFREEQHFDFTREQLLPRLRLRGGAARIWSAGCSSGEEPYTLAMVLRDELGDGAAARILATDISARVLARARAGIYADEIVQALPVSIRQRHFRRAERGWQVAEPLREMIRFARLNLMDAWPMKGPFDLIFCRNVMIYFDKPTQQALVERFWQMLAPGGHLFVGHSESLAALTHRFRYVQPAVYEKVAP